MKLWNENTMNKEMDEKLYENKKRIEKMKKKNPNKWKKKKYRKWMENRKIIELKWRKRINTEFLKWII